MSESIRNRQPQKSAYMGAHKPREPQPSDRENPFVQGLELQPMDVELTQPPEWFERLLAADRIDNHSEVDGCPLHYLEWGKGEGKQDLLLVHGNNAHAHWFLPTGALLSDRFHTVSMTFSGMGDSGWRERYDREQFCSDIIGLIDNLGLHKPIIMAHSFGGMISLPTAARLGDRLGGLIVVDFVARPKDKVREWFVDRPPSRPTRVYPDKETVMGRFRLLPDQECANQWLLRYIAEHSVRRVAGGWTWKFDPGIYDHMRLGNEHEAMLRNLKVPVAFLYGAQTVEFDLGEVEDMLQMLPPAAPVVAMPEAQHHLMLDQPLAFAELIGRLADALIEQGEQG